MGQVQNPFIFDTSGCSDLEDHPDGLQVRWDWENDGIYDTGNTGIETANHQFNTPGIKTNGVWQAASGYENHPVITIRWYSAVEFCNFYNYRLPTEAEWEYAALSGGGHERYPGTNNLFELTDYAWYIANRDGDAHQVGTRNPNGLGLYDMGSNVIEWCQDWYADNYYSISPANNPQGPATGTHRVVRGGSYRHAHQYLTVCSRSYYDPMQTDLTIGFRCARSVTAKH
ncbi:SUMF1/EgtB/PvdO family nonheme iron enzyme [candidate division KSB1 bacterium]|nr:SUMF1/EgtB/PvdO family nonheme iron enzyme [candidate division KSB1 bacterium]